MKRWNFELLTAVLLLLAAPRASATQAELVQTDSVPLARTSWTDTVSFEKFDPDLGLLTQVDLKLTGTVGGQLAHENLDPQAVSVFATFAADLLLRRPSGSSNFTTLSPSQQFINNLAGYDGTIDFAGPGGITVADPGGTLTRTFTALAPNPDLALFLGTGGAGSPGSLDLPILAINGSSVSAPFNVVTVLLLQATADVELTYTYTPDCNQNGIPDSEDLVNGAPDCDGNGVPDECDIADGSPDCNMNDVPDECETFLDCNGDSIPDECQLVGNDCNSNQIPDECEPDCDNNGTPDDCDIANGVPDCNMNGVIDLCDTFLDCNADNIPDECQLQGNDCNSNQIPDECEPDCDNNGTPDDCDIANGVPDCNMNGVIDLCDAFFDCNDDQIPDECQLTGNDCDNNQVPDECQVDCNTNGVPDSCETFVDCNGDQIPDECQLGGNDCNSNQIPDECEPDCDNNGTPDDCDIANGVPDCNMNGFPDVCDTFLDCNGDLIPDECQLTGNDCNSNQLPDDCELDCNNNGTPDDCDLTNGAPDCNSNGIPDECDPDCDNNTVPDDCDLALGATDSDMDGILDACDPFIDCDGNGVMDADDLLMGSATDCNANGIPDSCDLMHLSLDVNQDGIPDECTPELQFLCVNDSVPLMTSGWMDSVTLDRFDPDLGILETVLVTLTGRIVGQAAFESTTNKPATVTTTFSASMLVFRPDGVSSITSITPSQQFVDMVPPFDGTIDFDGPSGMTFAGIDVTRTRTHSSPPLLSDLALFTGTPGMAPAGSIVLPVAVNGTSTGAGAGSLIIQFTQQASATVEVCYVYRLDCNMNGIPDEEDIAAGSPDIDNDGVPDECVPLPSFCNGDGGDQLGCTDCPCGNNAPLGTIGGCLNSALTSARLFSSGDTSVSLPPNSVTDLRFALSGAPPSALCVLNSGDALAPTSPSNPCFGLDSGAQSVSFDGLRCTVMNTRRHGSRAADANGDVGVTNIPWGGEGAPVPGLAVAGGGFVAGQTRYFQVWNRDDPLAQCMRGRNTSQAIEVTFTP